MAVLPMYSTSVIGSLPRPQWVIDLVNEREKGLIQRDSDLAQDASDLRKLHGRSKS